MNTDVLTQQRGQLGGHSWLAVRRQGGPRPQAGFTLIEVLLSMTIGLILLVPVGGWMVMAMQQHGPTAGRFSEASQARIANTYLSRDVGSAELVRVDLADPGNPDQSCGPDVGDQVLMQLVDDDPEIPRRTVYVTNVDSEGVAGVWRRTCDTTVEGKATVLDQVRVLRGVDMTAAVAPSAQCAPVSEKDCKQVTFNAKLVSGTPINVRAMRRSTLDASYLGTLGNQAPRALIDSSYTKRIPRNTALILDGSGSTDVDGTIQSWSWTVSGPGVPGNVYQTAVADEPAKRSFTFLQLGTYQVQLEVSDGIDTARTTVGIEVYNEDPIAALVVNGSAEGRVQGGDVPEPYTFVFDASASHDPEDGMSLSYEWALGDGAVVLSGDGGSSPQVQYAEGSDPLGDRTVSVTVRDSEGGSTVAQIAIRLLPPGGTEPPDPGGSGPIIVATGGEVNGQLVATPGKASRAGTVGAGRANVSMTFGTREPAGTDAWELRRGAQVVDSATGASYFHSFGAGDAGDWTIGVTPSGGTEVTLDFRLNAPPVAEFSWVESGRNPTSVSFDGTGSHDDGGITSHLWNFGFPGEWLPDDGPWESTDPKPAHVYDHPGIYGVALQVTDDDGASTLLIRQLAIPGTVSAPAAGSFNGGAYSWRPIPGAETYQVHLAVSGCSAATTANYDVALGADPSITTAYPGCQVVASYRARVAGQWSPKSPDTQRP